METPDALGIIAGNGAYPLLLAEGARRSGVGRIVAAAFQGETDPRLGEKVDAIRLTNMERGDLPGYCPPEIDVGTFPAR